MSGPNPSGLCMCGCGQPTRLARADDSRNGIVRGQPQRFVFNHQSRAKWARTHAERVESWLERCDRDESGCWLWTGATADGGYGRAGFAERDGTRRFVAVHREVYEHLVGPIPAGLELDHLCRTPACCNPEHLEPVTHRENVLRGEALPAHRARQTHCHRGHEFTPDNTYEWGGRRYCRACRVRNRGIDTPKLRLA